MPKTIEVSIDYEDGVDAYGDDVNDLIGKVMEIALEEDWVLGVACGMDYRTADIEGRLQATVKCILRTSMYHAKRGEVIDAGKLHAHVQEHLDPTAEVQ